MPPQSILNRGLLLSNRLSQQPSSRLLPPSTLTTATGCPLLVAGGAYALQLAHSLQQATLRLIPTATCGCGPFQCSGNQPSKGGSHDLSAILICTMWTILSPFVLLILIYYITTNIHDANAREESIRSAILKCLPIFYLAGSAAWVNVPDELAHLQKYIALGLLASMFGDWFLNWMQRFYLPGALCFMIAHCLYVTAFGLVPWEVPGGAFFAAVTIFMGAYTNRMAPKENPLAKNLMTLYFAVISVMAWRAYAYCTIHPNQPGSLQAVVGAAIFLVSDFLIVATSWHVKTKYQDLLVMTTYYAAQLLISCCVMLPSFTPERAAQ